MWLLGAGASAAAGIPTAWDMIWEFKQQLFVSQRRVSPKAVTDLSNPAVRRSLQSFIDGLGRYPSTGAPDEYAALFEAAYPSEHDRRTYIAAKLAGAKPSFGHIALAALMKAGRTRIVWTRRRDSGPRLWLGPTAPKHRHHQHARLENDSDLPFRQRIDHSCRKGDPRLESGAQPQQQRQLPVYFLLHKGH